MGQQFTLGVRWRDDASFDNYYTGDNGFELYSLKQFLTADTGYAGIYLWGKPHCGCSHLLQASCQLMSDRPVVYLPLSMPGMTPEVLENLDALDLVCLDDLDDVLGDKEWERAVFDNYNRLYHAGTRFIYAGHQSPFQLAFGLADLQSRVQSMLSLELAALNDHQKIDALKMRARNRGLTLNDDVAAYLMNHYQRDMKSLIDALDKLDKVSLAEKRRITIPFAKQALDV